MNKTITINLGGIVFHIDDNAYDVLRTYLEKLNAHFAGPSGKEVLNDIEARMAEMFSEKLTASKNVIVLEDVNSVITVMGTPEDIASATTETQQQKHRVQQSVTQRSPRRPVVNACTATRMIKCLVVFVPVLLLTSISIPFGCVSRLYWPYCSVVPACCCTSCFGSSSRRPKRFLKKWRCAVKR
jgi:hypothetical protein